MKNQEFFLVFGAGLIRKSAIESALLVLDALNLI
jgi:hypothetical protein